MWKFEDDRTATVLTAREHVACGHNGPVVSLPETAILFYMHSGPQYLQEHYPCTLLTEKLPRFLQGGPVWKLDEKICFLDGGRGAPQAVDTIETLAVLGVKRVVTVGMCGGFSEQVAVGDILVPDKAFVEEGTSLHYYEQIDFAQPDEQLFEQLKKIPGGEGAAHRHDRRGLSPDLLQGAALAGKGRRGGGHGDLRPVERREVFGPAGGFGADDFRLSSSAGGRTGLGMEDDHGDAPAIVPAGDGDCFLRINKKTKASTWWCLVFLPDWLWAAPGETSYPILVSASLSSREIFSSP